MGFIKRLIDGLSGAMLHIAGWAVVAMMVFTCLDVVLRYLRMPVPFMHDLVALLSAVAVSFALADTTRVKGHVAVSIVVSRFPERWQHVIDSLTGLLGVLLFSLAAWKLFGMGRDFQTAGETAMSSHIPLFPFAYGMSLACLTVCLVLINEFITNLGKLPKSWK